jgi:predicted PurR-regulated permease PerM
VLIIGFSDNVVRPWVQSSQTQLHPLLAVLGIFGGLELFGASGIVLGPIIAAMAFWTVGTYAELRRKAEKVEA